MVTLVVVQPTQPSELPLVCSVRCTKVLGSLPSLSPLLDGSDVCALSQEPFPVAVKQSPLVTHGSLQVPQPIAHGLLQILQLAMHELMQVEVPFLTAVGPEAKNMPPPRADS